MRGGYHRNETFIVMIKDNVKKEQDAALKSGNEIRLSTLRMLSAAIHNAEIDKKGDLNEEEELEVVKKEAKKRKDAIEAYEKGGAQDRADKEKKELKVLQEYLPEDLTDDELEKIVNDAISKTGANDPSDLGKVMGLVMGSTKGRADGTKVSEMVKAKLS